MFITSQYLASHVWTLFLNTRLPFPCLQSNTKATTSANPNSPLNPAPIATSLSDVDDDEDDAFSEAQPDIDAFFVAVTVAVEITVVATVAVIVLLRLGDVEPDVRLNITNPASTQKGALLPLVGTQHVSFPEMPSSQQNLGSSLGLGLTICTFTPPSKVTAMLISASRLSYAPGSNRSTGAQDEYYHRNRFADTPNSAMSDRCSCLW